MKSLDMSFPARNAMIIHPHERNFRSALKSCVTHPVVTGAVASAAKVGWIQRIHTTARQMTQNFRCLFMVRYYGLVGLAGGGGGVFVGCGAALFVCGGCCAGFGVGVFVGVVVVLF